MKIPSDDELRSMEEEDIPKQILVQRLFDLRDILGRSETANELHWQESIKALANQFNEMMKQERNFMDQKQADIESILKEHSQNIDQKVDNAMAQFSQKLDEYMGRVEQKFNTLQNDMATKLDDSEVKFGSNQKDFNISAKKELELIVNNSISKLVATVNEYKRAVDIRFNGLESLVEKTAQKETEKYFLDLTKTVNEGRDFISAFKKDIADQITKFQSDTGLRVSGVNQKLDSVLEKFRAILKDL